MAEFIGTIGSDKLAGTGDADVIEGRNGNDFLVGRGGDDFIRGGGGADFILGGTGTDTIIGGTGRDTLFGGRGDDILNGGSGKDTLSGDFGFDRLTGGSGDDNFVFNANTAGVDENGNFAWDTITDFADGDTLTFNDLPPFFSLNFQQVGDDVHVSVSQGLVICVDEELCGDFPPPREFDIEASGIEEKGDFWMPLSVLVVVVEDAMIEDVANATTGGFDDMWAV